MTDCGGEQPIRTECATDIAVLKRDMSDTRADVKEIHDLLVKNGFANAVTKNATAIWWMIRIGGAVIVLGIGAITWIYKLHLIN